MNVIKRNKLHIFIFLFLSTIFILLAYKDVFSVRTLVPNIEPYPDTFYYSNPAWNLAGGKGYVMKAFDYESKILTPPLYSLYLTPFFMLFHDLRVFYFANILLGLGSLAVFILIIKKLTTGVFGIFMAIFLGFLYVTNYYVYTVPSLLMAENITYFLSLVGLLILVSEVNKRTAILSSITTVGLVLIKFSNIPLSAALAFLYFIELFKSKVSIKIKKSYFASMTLSLAIFIVYIYFSGILSGHKNLEQGASFGTNYFIPNFNKYLSFLMGNAVSFIWYHHKMISNLFVIPILIGLIWGLRNKKLSWITMKLFIYGMSVILFMSVFYYVDARYIFMVYPILLIFLLFFFIEVKQRMSEKLSIGLAIIMGVVFLLLPQFSLVENERMVISFKKQIGLNLKHAETPWHYIAVQNANEFFSDTDPSKTYFATFMAPYFVNYYANGNYQYLPITTLFEFYKDKKNAHESYYRSLPAYYERLLKQGNRIYITSYWENNIREVWPFDYINLTKHFNLTKVKEGCLDSCSIYEVTLKEN